MSSKYAQFFAGKYHIVTANSVEMLLQMGFDSDTERVYELHGIYNQELVPSKSVPTRYSWIEKKHCLNARFEFKFKTEPVWEKAVPLEHLLNEAREEGAVDITITKLGALMKYETTISYNGVPQKIENITQRVFKRWNLNPSAFEKRGSEPPEIKIYQQFRNVLRKLAADLHKETVLRRHASIIINQADNVLNLNDLRNLLRYRPWALVLERRARGLQVVTLEEIEKEGWKV